MLNKLIAHLSAVKLPGGRYTKQILIGLGGTGLVGAIVLSLWRADQGYVALFGSQENIPVAQVAQALGAENIAYRVHPNTGEILVTSPTLPRARMALAAKGITAILPEGYELMDKDEMLGSSQFIQNIRYKRSLEGELARSVMAMDRVESARVHLGLSENSSFVLNNKPESSASVFVQLTPGKNLGEQQVAAIVKLVTGSIPGMKPASVSIVDQHGQLLSAHNQDDPAYQNRASLDIIQRIKEDTTQNIASMLTSIVGPGNYRISVAPQVDLSQVEETQERLGKDPQISDEQISQEQLSEVAMGIPGSLSNRPVAPPAPGGQQAAPASAGTPPGRNTTQRKFVFDRDIRHIRHPGFRLEKLHIAVALNQNAPALAAITPEQITAMTQLLERAAGVHPERGDALMVNVVAFTEPAPLPSMEKPRWWQDPDMQFWGKHAGIGLLALLVLLFGIRPLVRRVGQSPDSTLAATAQEEPPQARLPGTPLDEQAAVPESMPGTLNTVTFQQEEALPPLSSGLETKLNFLQTLATKETERMAEVLKQWINSNDRNDKQEP